MNLAEIRKKSEAVKQDVSSPAAVRPGSVDEPFEELPLENDPFFQESSAFAGEQVEEDWTDCPPEAPAGEDECVSELIETSPEAVPEPELAWTSSQGPTPGEDVSPVPVELTRPNPAPVQTACGVQSAGYDPLATIISGREWSAESEETSLYNALPISSGGLEEYLCFRVANEEYAINIMAIKEIIKPREVTEVPRMPEFISGVISLRGVIIPIMDMRLRLALPAGERTGKERVIVLRNNSGFCGVLVDEVVQVARINKTDIEGPPAVLEGIDREFVKGLGRFDKRMLILLNLDTILDICIN